MALCVRASFAFMRRPPPSTFYLSCSFPLSYSTHYSFALILRVSLKYVFPLHVAADVRAQQLENVLTIIIVILLSLSHTMVRVRACVCSLGDRLLAFLPTTLRPSSSLS